MGTFARKAATEQKAMIARSAELAIVDQNGGYHGNLSTNPYDPNSTSNPYGRYGSPYSPDSLNNPCGAGNPYGTQKYYVIPQQ